MTVMLRTRQVSVILGAVLALACEAAQVPGGATVGPPVDGSRATEEATVLELRLDQPVAHADLELLWLELQDSRCPRNVVCVWEGEAVVTLEVARADLAATRVELVLPGGKPRDAVSAAGHLLRLLAVEPYPVEGITPDRGELVASVEVRAE